MAPHKQKQNQTWAQAWKFQTFSNPLHPALCNSSYCSGDNTFSTPPSWCSSSRKKTRNLPLSSWLSVGGAKTEVNGCIASQNSELASRSRMVGWSKFICSVSWLRKSTADAMLPLRDWSSWHASRKCCTSVLHWSTLNVAATFFFSQSFYDSSSSVVSKMCLELQVAVARFISTTVTPLPEAAACAGAKLKIRERRAASNAKKHSGQLVLGDVPRGRTWSWA